MRAAQGICHLRYRRSECLAAKVPEALVRRRQGPELAVQGITR